VHWKMLKETFLLEIGTLGGIYDETSGLFLFEPLDFQISEFTNCKPSKAHKLGLQLAAETIVEEVLML